MGRREKKSLWERTRFQHLLRNRKSGLYYGRFTISGKQKWFALGTAVESVATQRLRDKAAEVDEVRASTGRVAGASATMKDLMIRYRDDVEADLDIAESTKETKRTGWVNLQKTWPELALMMPDRVTPKAVQAWIARYRVEGTSYVPPGAKTVLKGNSVTSVRRAITALRHVFEIAIEMGQVFRNPVVEATRRKRGARRPHAQRRPPLILPDDDQFRRVIRAIEDNGAVGGWNSEAADFCRFMLFTGARVGEAARTTWGEVFWKRHQIHLPGTKSRNSDRTIPIFPDLKILLERLKQRRLAAARYRPEAESDLLPGKTLFRIRECQKTIDAACERVGVVRFTHHIFRHLFATKCLEAGVDTLTISKWLGHSDGGVLVQKTYGHLRLDHSDRQAKKVRFHVG